MAPHSSTLAWKIPWTEESGGLQSMGSLESDTTEQLHFHFSLSCIGEGNGNLLQCSCLENPRDRGAWWAAFYGVTQSRTRLKRLSSSSSMHPCIAVTDGWMVGILFLSWVPSGLTICASVTLISGSLHLQGFEAGFRFPSQSLKSAWGSENAEFSPLRPSGPGLSGV